MWIKKLLSIAAVSAVTTGAISSIIFTSTSCAEDEGKFISVVSTEKAILNKATFTFQLIQDTPEAIKLAWVKDAEDSKQIQIKQNHDIPVDQATGVFALEFEVLVLPKDWTQIDFGIALQYEIDGQSFFHTYSNLTLDNGTSQTESIKSIYGKTKMVTSTSDDANFSFCFDESVPAAELPNKINKVTFYDLPKKFEDVITLKQTSDIDVDPTTRQFDILAKFNKKIDEVIPFSLLMSYDINGNNYCYYTDTLSLILFESDDTNNVYLTLQSTSEPGFVSYKANSTNGSRAAQEKNLFYRINDNKSWSYLSLNEQIYMTPGSKIDFRGINDEWSSVETKYQFDIGLPVNLSGSPEALLHGGVVSNTLSGDYCFAQLFEHCTNIVSVDPNFLPMYTTTPHCYDRIFAECENLCCESAFLLPAKQLEDACYCQMFAGSHIHNIKYYANTLPTEQYCDSWLKDCKDFGDVLLPFDIDVRQIKRDDRNIPIGWTIQTFKEPLTIIAKENCRIKLYGYREDETIDPEYTKAENKQILYSCNHPNETFKPVPALFSDEIFLEKGEYAYFQGKNTNGWYNQATDDHHIGFYVSEKCDVNGNIMSLVDPELATTIIPSTEGKWCGFPSLFSGSFVENIGSYFLDVTDRLPQGCFKHMFYDCDNLINTGSIATLVKRLSIQTSCCEGMFDGCYNLETIDVDATTGMVPRNFADSCFKEMFANCVNLLYAPKVTDEYSELQPHCLEEMFSGCAYLKSSEPITGLSTAEYCCSEMFANCINLEQCPDMNIQIPNRYHEYCFYGMYRGCISIQDIPDMQSWSIYPPHACECMFQSCTSLNPSIDSTHRLKIFDTSSLHYYCFYNMFKGCTKLVNMHVDLGGNGKTFEEAPFLESYFENWLPNDYLYGRCIYLSNCQGFDFDNIPDPFPFKPSNWNIQPETEM